MELDESRRLTGPNLFTRLPGAICDILIEPDEQPALIAAWRVHARALLDRLGWRESVLHTRQHLTGVSLVITAPMDALYAATDVNEAAFDAARRQLSGDAPKDVEAVLERLAELIADEQDARLPALAAAAAERSVPFLIDDDEVSIGYGAKASIWPTNQAPDVDDVDWASAGRVGDVPVGLITGTNGKSTTVRLAAAIIEASGRAAGVTSTDYIRVGDEVIDTGDYSGPGGARQLLRHPKTEVALLEVARGGMLRRGLGVTVADAALVTNVAADHLGEYGIHTVPELRDAKFIVQKALTPDRPLIVNADDEGVVDYVARFSDQTLIWFAESLDNPVVESHTQAGHEAFTIAHGDLLHCKGTVRSAIVAIEDIPVTLRGQARHNVQNALAAAALCSALGADHAAIRAGLCGFAGGHDDNPGRGNFFEGKGVRAVVDFAHNEHGLRAMASTIARMPAKRRLVLMGQAGDRSDELIRGLTHSALAANPDQLVVCQLPGYERGRAVDAVQKLIVETATEAGIAPGAIHCADSPVDGTRFALDWAEDGDLLLILALTQRGPCIQMIERRLQS